MKMKGECRLHQPQQVVHSKFLPQWSSGRSVYHGVITQHLIFCWRQETHPAPMTQWDAILTVWCTRDRVDIVFKSPTTGDSTPKDIHRIITIASLKTIEIRTTTNFGKVLVAILANLHDLFAPSLKRINIR